MSNSNVHTPHAGPATVSTQAVILHYPALHLPTILELETDCARVLKVPSSALIRWAIVAREHDHIHLECSRVY
jgi:hypothetical protein